MRTRRLVLLSLLSKLLCQQKRPTRVLNLFVTGLRSDQEAYLNLRPEVVENHLGSLNDDDFKILFRMPRLAYFILLQEIKVHFVRRYARLSSDGGTVQRGRPSVPLALRLAVLLYRLGHQDTVHSIATRFNVSPGFIVICTQQMLTILNEDLQGKYIVWPNAEERRRICAHAMTFHENATHFQDAVGAIDGSYIAINPNQIPLEHVKEYFCRKQYYAMLLQGTVDFHRRFIDINVGLPGSAHDSRHLQLSCLGRNLSNDASRRRFLDDLQYLLGDLAYPLRSWMIVPFRDDGHLTDAKHRFNFLHSSLRRSVECSYGMLKMKWACLKGELNFPLKWCTKVITGCCVLHNFLIHHRAVDDWQQVEEVLEEMDEILAQSENPDDTGVMRRSTILATF